MCFGDRPEEEGARIQLRDILHCVMIILKPSWITHSDRSSGSRGAKPCIYSLHAHPDGRRLATGGLDTTVRIWNTEPILDETAEADPNCHRLLCTMTRHNGAVLCVRWSNNDGRYLASSSDNDNVIIIWELDSDTSMMTTFGSLETNYENWRPLKYLRGHDSDVQDLAWSKDNQYLASCGVDGSVIIWDGVSFEKVTKIDQHGGFVKGITWDPVGKFLASQSDDKVLKIWRTSDWKVEQEIRGPFINAPGTTLFRRMSWSPNGSHIVTANAVNGVHCIAAIINRDEWTADVSLVGHQLPIEVASFNPKMFYMCEDPNGSSEEATKMLSTVCALGGQDRSVSIWVTRFSEPLCVAADIFNNSIYDISWSPDGQTLYACSQDGSVVCLKLEEELSDLVPDSEVEYQLSKYGSKDKALLPEAPVQLDLEDKNAVAKKAAASKRIANLMGDSSAEKRPAAEADNQQQKAANGLHIGETSSGPTPPLQTVPENIAPVNNLTPSTPSDVALEQKVTIGKDGRKRITPVVIRSTTPAISMASSSFTQQNTETGPRPNATEYDLPVSLPVGGVSAAVVGTKRKPGSETTMDEEQITRRRPVWIDSGVVPPAVSHSRVKLGIPKVRASLVRKAEGDHIVMECRNPTSEHGSSATKEGLHNEFARVSATRRGQELWTDYLPSTVLQMAGDARHFVVSCEDGSIHVYSNAGRRVLPPLMMDSTPTILHCENNWLLCLTSTGLAYTWDLVNRKCCLSEVSIAPILQIASVNAEELKAAPSIKDVRIHTNGVPLIVTNYRQAFAYDIDMKVWLRVSDARYILSEFWTSSSVAPKTNPLGWLSNAMSRSQGLDPAGKSMMALINADKKASGIMTISYLEMQMAVAVLLDSPAEYQEFMMQYARRLAAENCQQKAQELCRWLAGPPFVNDETTGWEPTILGKLAKRELLKQVLPLLGSNRKLQRIVAEYSSLVS